MRASGMRHSTQRAILNLAVLTVLVYPATVFAEVSDKEPSADLFWKIGLAAAIICLVGARIKLWSHCGSQACSWNFTHLMSALTYASNKALRIFYRPMRLLACRCSGYSRAISGIEKA
jgi:hypothetical protein